MIAKSFGSAKLKKIGKQISKYIPYLLYPGEFIQRFDILGHRRFEILEDKIDKLFEDISWTMFIVILKSNINKNIYYKYV